MNNDVKTLTGGGRIEYIDLAKGFSIFLVVWVHLAISLDLTPPFRDFIYTFFMPLFFFLSGVFFKRYNSFKVFLKRKTNKLLIPFLFFYLIFTVLMPNILLYGFGYETKDCNAFGWQSLWVFVTKETFTNGTIWFLLCLYWVSIIFYLIVSLAEHSSRNAKTQILIEVSCITALGLSGYAMADARLNLPALFDSACSAIPYFGLGYILKRYTPLFEANKFDKHLLLLSFILFAITSILSCHIEYHLNYFLGHNIAQAFIGGICGTIAVILLSKKIGHLPCFSFWGRYSLIILCTHLVVIKIFARLTKLFHVEENLGVWTDFAIVLVLTLFSYYLIVPLFLRFIPWFTGHKDLIKVQGAERQK